MLVIKALAILSVLLVVVINSVLGSLLAEDEENRGNLMLSRRRDASFWRDLQPGYRRSKPTSRYSSRRNSWRRKVKPADLTEVDGQQNNNQLFDNINLEIRGEQNKLKLSRTENVKISNDFNDLEASNIKNHNIGRVDKQKRRTRCMPKNSVKVTAIASPYSTEDIGVSYDIGYITKASIHATHYQLGTSSFDMKREGNTLYINNVTDQRGKAKASLIDDAEDGTRDFYMSVGHKQVLNFEFPKFSKLVQPDPEENNFVVILKPTVPAKRRRSFRSKRITGC